MKLLENPRLSALTAFLSAEAARDSVNSDVAQRDGRPSRGKRAGEDKKLAKELEAQFAAESRTRRRRWKRPLRSAPWRSRRRGGSSWI